MKRTSLCSLGSLALLLAASPLWGNGTVSGVLRDAQTGLSLEGAQVSVPGVATTQTDRSGRFFLSLPAGTHVLSIDYLGAVSDQASVDVREGETSRVERALTIEVYELEAIAVQARVLGTARALNQQRSADNLRSIVASDAIGKFPDENAAQALSRLPGISIERDQGEGRFVIIRGIDPELNSVSIDGVAIATPAADERKTLLDTIPTETLAALEVTKAVLPDQPGDSIGGHINLLTANAFDRDERFMSFSVSTLYSDLTEEFGYKGSASYSDFLDADKTWGLTVSAVWSERKFGSDNNEAEPWSLEEGDDGKEYWIQDDEIQFREYNLSRERKGATFDLEYRPNDSAQYFVRGSFAEYTDHEIRNALALGFGEAWEYEDSNGDDVDDDMVEFSNIGANGFTAENVGVSRELKDREETMSIYALSAGGVHRLDQLTLDYKVGYSRAEEDTPFDFEVKFAQLNEDHAEDPTDGDYEGYLETPDFVISNTRQDILSIRSLGTAGNLDPSDAGDYEFDGIEDAYQKVTEKHVTGEINALYTLDESRHTYVKAGALARAKTKESDLTVRTSDDNPGEIDELAGFTASGVRDSYGTGFPYIRQDIRDYYLANANAFAMEDDVEGSAIEDYQADETVLAGYFMAGTTLAKLQIIAGARVERTSFETDGFLYNDDTEAVTPTHFEHDYTNFLPGIHFRYEVNANLIARASWTNAIARPTFAQLSPGIVEEDGDREAGNPMLDPYESMNWDASIEYYLEDLGVISVAVFHKNIQSFVYEQEIEDGAPNGDLTTFLNGDDGHITGVELGYQQRLTFLPIDGFSFLTNATFSDSKATVMGEKSDDPSRDLPFVKQSDLVGNVAVSYEHAGFFIRLSGTYRDDYLDEVGGKASEDRFVDSHFQVDLSTAYTFASDWTVFADLINLTNEPFKAYWGESHRLAQFEEYGWSAVVGIKWTR